MAVLTETNTDESLRLQLHKESVSFTSAPGTNVSSRTCPTGKAWILLSVNGKINEAGGAGKTADIFTDDGATLKAILSNDAQGRHLWNIDEQVVWNGYHIITSGERVGMRWYAVAGAVTADWQFVAVEIALVDLRDYLSGRR